MVEYKSQSLLPTYGKIYDNAKHFDSYLVYGIHQDIYGDKSYKFSNINGDNIYICNIGDFTPTYSLNF